MTRSFFLRNALLWAGLHGFMAVAFGAFAAHGVTDPQAIGWLETGSRYQLAHAAALLALGLAAGTDREVGGLGVAAAGFTIGPLLFSGALYGLALTGWRALGAVAPLGGLAMIVGWLALVGAAVRRLRRSSE